MVTCPTFAEELCHLRQRIAENPCETEVRFYRALTCVAGNELDLAAVELLQLVASNPNNPSFFYYLGYVESERARYQEAVRHFSAAIELDAVFIDAINDRGVVYALMQRYHDAIKDYDRVLAIDPDLAEAYNNRGISMVRLKRYKEAKADYDHAIRLYSGDPKFYLNRAMLYEMLGKLRRATADYRSCLALDEQYTKAIAGLERCRIT